MIAADRAGPLAAALPVAAQHAPQPPDLVFSGRVGHADGVRRGSSFFSPTRLRQCRTERGLTLEQLATGAVSEGARGLDPTAISHYEGGRRQPDVTLIGPLARALGVTNADLLEPVGDLTLRYLRERAGLSQGQVADDLGIKTAAYSKLELGQTLRVSPDRVSELTRVFGVDQATVLDALRNSQDQPRQRPAAAGS